MPKVISISQAHRGELGYAGDMLLNGREAILSRVHLLKAEISDIQRLNEQYAQQRRTLPAQQNHAQRRGRLEQIVEELKALTNRKIQ
jgi:hypothetical protein